MQRIHFYLIKVKVVPKRSKMLQHWERFSLLEHSYPIFLTD
jgi:hypothetical protein